MMTVSLFHVLTRKAIVEACLRRNATFYYTFEKKYKISKV